MRKFLLIISLIFISIFIIPKIKSPSYLKREISLDLNNYTQQILVKDKELWVEIVNTPEKISKGLSGRDKLDQNQGMLFIFDPPQEVSFWMKDMNFPIDIIFISDNKIIDIKHSAPIPDKTTSLLNLPQYSPSQKVDMVLETNAGWCEENNVIIGDKIELL